MELLKYYLLIVFIVMFLIIRLNKERPEDYDDSDWVLLAIYSIIFPLGIAAIFIDLWPILIKERYFKKCSKTIMAKRQKEYR